ncbi:MAG: hypothetical protein GKR90_05780 [Pseudomonadales bacterium]|nr:hypothetical protein [Pseudomonadales bacterium]
MRILPVSVLATFFLFCCLTSCPTWAQSADDTDAATKSSPAEGSPIDTPAPAPQSTTSAGNPERAKSKNKKAGDIFRPSEEISEDFAVSFPVDI